MTSNAVERLQAVGMTEWEARAYLALLEESPASGYAIAKRSEIPRSKIYEVLSSLVNKGAAHVSHAGTALYGPLSPEELIERLRSQASQRIDAAEASIMDYSKQIGSNSVIWDLEGRLDILARARQLVHDARKRIMLEVWSPEADELRGPLNDAARRGVQVVAVAYGDPQFSFAKVYMHPSTDEVTTGLGGRWLVMSVDGTEILAGIVSSGARSRAAWTGHPALVVPITELISHDIYKLEMLASRQTELEEDFGPGLIRLREKFAWAEQQDATIPTSDATEIPSS